MMSVLLHLKHDFIMFYRYRVYSISSLFAVVMYDSGIAGQEETEPDMEQLTGSDLGKENDKAVYCHPAFLTYMQSTSCEMSGWMKHKLESRLTGEISVTSDTQREGNGNPLQYSCLEKSHGWRSLVGCSPWGP